MNSLHFSCMTLQELFTCCYCSRFVASGPDLGQTDLFPADCALMTYPDNDPCWVTLTPSVTLTSCTCPCHIADLSLFRVLSPFYPGPCHNRPGGLGNRPVHHRGHPGPGRHGDSPVPMAAHPGHVLGGHHHWSGHHDTQQALGGQVGKLQLRQ